MASISKQPNGRRTIQFTGADGARRSIRLGKVSHRDAEAVKLHVERLAAAAITGHSVQDDTAHWLKDLSDVLAGKLAAVGLIPKRESMTLGAFADEFLKRPEMKPSTATFYGHTIRNLKEHFGEDKPLHAIRPHDADGFRDALVKAKLAKNTINRRCVAAASIFKAAMRRELVTANPFAGIGGVVTGNPERMYFLSEADALKVLAACPTPTWKAAFALARWGGLRVPSELIRLRWQDVNFDTKRITVRASKTEHHPDGGVRVIPLFPELEKPLVDLLADSPDGAIGVFPATWTDSKNLRKGLTAIIERAGLKPWPKLWQNLRSTRETELFERYPAHVAAAWIGNSVNVALQSYTQMKDGYFDSATGVDTKALRKAVHDSARPKTAKPEDEIKNGDIPAEKAQSGTGGNVDDGRYRTRTNANLPKKTRNRKAGAAKSGALPTENELIPGLTDITAAIARLDKAGLAALKKLLQAHRPNG